MTASGLQNPVFKGSMAKIGPKSEPQCHLIRRHGIVTGKSFEAVFVLTGFSGDSG
jgi:hypothetical protein